MEDQTKKLAIVVSRGLDDERATVAFTIANTGIASGQQVTMFMVSAATKRSTSSRAPRSWARPRCMRRSWTAPPP